MAIITKEDIIDAIDETNENRLEMLTEYWQSLLEEDGTDPKHLVAHSLSCAKMLYAAKGYQDTLDWLDAIGLEIAKTHGEESDQYVAFIEDEDLDVALRAYQANRALIDGTFEPGFSPPLDDYGFDGNDRVTHTTQLFNFTVFHERHVQ